MISEGSCRLSVELPPTSLPADCVLPNEALLEWHEIGTINSCVEEGGLLLEPNIKTDEEGFTVVEDCSSWLWLIL